MTGRPLLQGTASVCAVQRQLGDHGSESLDDDCFEPQGVSTVQRQVVGGPKFEVDLDVQAAAQVQAFAQIPDPIASPSGGAANQVAVFVVVDRATGRNRAGHLQTPPATQIVIPGSETIGRRSPMLPAAHIEEASLIIGDDRHNRHRRVVTITPGALQCLLFLIIIEKTWAMYP